MNLSKIIKSKKLNEKLKNESIDCIEFSNQPEIYIARALSPALIISVAIEDKKAIVSISSEQKPKAIGKNGINVRLASMLTGYEIELKEISQSASNESQTKETEKSNLDILTSLFKE